MFNEIMNILKSKWAHIILVMAIAAIPAGLADAHIVLAPMWQGIFTLVAASVTAHGTNSYVKGN